MIEFKFQTTPHQICIIPTFGVISKKHYYGYPVFSIAFMWLNLNCCFIIGRKEAAHE